MQSGLVPFLIFATALLGQNGPQQPRPVQNWPSQDQRQFDPQRDPRDQREMPPPPVEGPPAPPQVTLPAGTWITVHVNTLLASDRNHQGDAFTATLARPLIANGFVVARRGQMIGGRVAEVQKAGRVQGVSKLGLELTDLSLVDGQQVTMRTALVQHSAGTSEGRDAVAVATTTGVGAAIGAGVNGGVGAGVGAAAGLVVGVLGVLFTPGRPTVIYPEDTLTFRLQEPITIATDRSPGAFQAVQQSDYEPRMQQRRPGPPAVPVGTPRPYYGYGYPYPYPYYYGPGYYGPSIYFSTGRGYYGGRYRRW
ncbi:MAG TPA: hypothetical protein VGP79_07820 [Bryobacteraceae bacterium]|nr:hypothetical protein [Bryobacteraceae bacterium]